MTTSITIIISIAGIAYSITMCVYGVSDYHAKSIASVYQQAFDDFFLLINTAISIIAWLMFMSTAGTTTPLVATLFVLAEAVFVMKELINMALFYWYEKPAVNLFTNQEHQRYQAQISIEFNAHEEMIWVNLVSAVLLTGIIAGWCLMPDSLLLGVLSLIAMGIVYWEKYNAIQRIVAALETTLQTTVGELVPWWMEPVEQIDPMPSNDAELPAYQNEDRYPMHASVTGSASLTGLFSRCGAQNQSKQSANNNDAYNHSYI
jgi:hypothetical protein